MKKFIFYPIWRVDETENRLQQFEENGFRVDSVTNSYWFTLTKKSNSKEFQYFFVYKSFKGQNMGTYSYSLENKYGANKVKTKFSYCDVYRVSMGYDESFMKSARADFIKSIILQNFIINFILFVLGIVICCFSATFLATLLGSIFSFIFFISSLYCLYGYVMQKKKCKRIEKSLCRSNQSEDGESSR